MNDLFVPFPKMARLSRPCTISEKLDGTNASITITEDGRMLVGSHTRWITPTNDNYGFAKWVEAHRDELFTLPVGTHFGEWWGAGIQRGYGGHPKTFSLFNTYRFCLAMFAPKLLTVTTTNAGATYQHQLPVCCSLVPVLEEGPFETSLVQRVVDELKENGSEAAPGYMNPEGVVIYHSASGSYFKKTIDGDHAPKSTL